MNAGLTDGGRVGGILEAGRVGASRLWTSDKLRRTAEGTMEVGNTKHSRGSPMHGYRGGHPVWQTENRLVA